MSAILDLSRAGLLVAALMPLPLVAQGVRLVEAGEENEREEERLLEMGADQAAGLAEENRLRQLGMVDDLRRRRSSPTMRQYARGLVAFKPRRIAPGATGEVSVVVSFHREAGVVAGSHFGLDFEPQQGSIRLGQPTLSDPVTGVVQPRFVGQLVWEDTAIFTVPVHVGFDAEHGKHDVRVSVVAELMHGVESVELGMRSMEVSGRLEVGDPLPRPPIPERGDLVGAVPAAIDVSPIAAPDPNDEVADLARAAQDELPVPAMVGDGPADEGRLAAQGVPDAPQDAGNDRWTLLTAVAALAALVGILVFARGRRSRVT